MQIRQTFKYRLYRATQSRTYWVGKRNRHLLNQIDIAGLVWNHALALQRRYYKVEYALYSADSQASTSDLAACVVISHA